MLTPKPITSQYDDARQDDLRVLIVGGGIAGVTAAGLLRRQGRHPVLIERAGPGAHPGYMLALMPMVDPVFDELDLWSCYRERSVPLSRYAVHAHNGRKVREDSLAGVLASYGDYRGIDRGELIDVLTPDAIPVSYHTTVTALQEGPTAVTATLTGDDTTMQLDFDIVIIADGIHSATRELVLGGRDVGVLDTNWGGWVVWAPEDADPDLSEEVWGAGFFLGVYPVLGKLGVFLGGSRADTKAGPAAFVDSVRTKLASSNPRIDSTLDTVARANDPYFWPLTDCRSLSWANGRTVLLGDSAAGFLPTAGIGAGMAMESAWVLASMLRNATPPAITELLQAYETSQRPRVEAAQNTSRQLAHLMFHRSRLVAVMRDVAMRGISLSVALRPIQRLLAARPDRATAARAHAD